MAAEPARALSPAPASGPVRWPPWPEVAYPVWPDDLSRWYLPEDDDMTLGTLLTALQGHLLPCLRKLLEEQNRDWFVNYEQKMRMDPTDQRVGICPDIYVLPCQPQDPDFTDWPAYLPGIPVPVFALEAVSPSNWAKDYVESPQKYAKLGVEELLLFDEPAMEGKSPASDPYVLQLYRKEKGGVLRRVYAGEGPVYSEVLGAWFRTVRNKLTVTRDEEGTSIVFTYEETERWWGKLEEEREERKEAEAKAKRERKARERAERQVRQEALAREAAEQAKKDAEAKVQQESLAREAAEQAKKDAEAKVQQEALARQQAEQAKHKAEEGKKHAEAKAQQEALARQQAEQAKRKAEEGKKHAEAKVQQEALARQQAEQAKRKAEEEKKNAEAKAQQEALARQQAEQAKREAEQQALDEARLALLEMAEVLQVPWTDDRRRHLDALDLPALRQLRAFLKQHRRWPD
jgi:Uma2 family endonuclease